MYGNAMLKRCNEICRANLKMEWNEFVARKEVVDVKRAWIKNFHAHMDLVSSFRYFLLLVNAFTVALTLKVDSDYHALNAFVILTGYVVLAGYQMVFLGNNTYGYTITIATTRIPNKEHPNKKMVTEITKGRYFKHSEKHALFAFLVLQMSVFMI